MRSAGVESDGRIALAMHRRHSDQLAPQQIDAAVHGDPQHGIFSEVAIAGGNQSGDAARTAQPQHGRDRAESTPAGTERSRCMAQLSRAVAIWQVLSRCFAR